MGVTVYVKAKANGGLEGQHILLIKFLLEFQHRGGVMTDSPCSVISPQVGISLGR